MCRAKENMCQRKHVPKKTCAGPVDFAVEPQGLLPPKAMGELPGKHNLIYLYSIHCSLRGLDNSLWSMLYLTFGSRSQNIGCCFEFPRGIPITIVHLTNAFARYSVTRNIPISIVHMINAITRYSVTRSVPMSICTWQTPSSVIPLFRYSVIMRASGLIIN